MIEEKPCKSQGKAKGFKGCGTMNPVEYRQYGLGKLNCKCFFKWLNNSEEGSKIIAQTIFKVQKPRLEFETYQNTEKERTSLKKAKNNTEVVVHAFIRERDKYKPCPCCGVEWSPNFQASHFYKAETFETLRYDLDNIHSGCPRCNLFLDGNHDNYALNLPNRIGKERYDALVEHASVDKHYSKVWDIDKLKTIRETVRKMMKELV